MSAPCPFPSFRFVSFSRPCLFCDLVCCFLSCDAVHGHLGQPDPDDELRLPGPPLHRARHVPLPGFREPHGESCFAHVRPAEHSRAHEHTHTFALKTMRHHHASRTSARQQFCWECCELGWWPLESTPVLVVLSLLSQAAHLRACVGWHSFPSSLNPRASAPLVFHSSHKRFTAGLVRPRSTRVVSVTPPLELT